MSIKQHLKISLLVILFLPILASLGFWQLDRAQEKQQELIVYQQRQELPAIPWQELMQQLLANDSLRYRAVTVEGVFDKSHYWLLDNQPRMGKPGYEVIMPLLTDNGVLLVNRGWLSASQRREELPDFDTPPGTVKIQGYLYPSQKNAILKNTASDLKVDWPRRVLQLDVIEENKTLINLYKKENRAQKRLNKTSLILRIDANSSGALLTDWPVINTKPEKHVGYAVQWFLMAVALLLLYGWFLFRARKES